MSISVKGFNPSGRPFLSSSSISRA